MSLQGKVALVTGASRGIGQAIAMELAGMGATVIGTATTDSGAEAITAYLKEAGYSGRGMRLQVTEEGACESVVDAVSKEFGDVAILVNNAGITRDNLLMRMKDEDWDDIFATNLRPVYKLSKAVMRGMMKARWGRIINVASVVGATGNAGQANYSSAKAAMFGFTKSLAKEIGSRGVTVNAVAPGFIDTDMTRQMPEAAYQQRLASVALGRIGAPDDVAQAALFLASDMSAYITGQVIGVDGGMQL